MAEAVFRSCGRTGLVFVFCAAVSSFAVLTACSKASSDGQGASPSIQPSATTAPSIPEATVEQVLSSYEALRTVLAADEFSAVPGLAKQLAAHAAGAALSAEGKDKGLLIGLSQAANAVAGSELTQTDAVRKQFGEVSRHVVQLLSDSEALRQGKYVFECPMAQGYRKWVQTSDSIENPYMGKQMLNCGAPSTWGS